MTGLEVWLDALAEGPSRPVVAVLALALGLGLDLVVGGRRRGGIDWGAAALADRLAARLLHAPPLGRAAQARQGIRAALTALAIGVAVGLALANGLVFVPYGWAVEGALLALALPAARVPALVLTAAARAEAMPGVAARGLDGLSAGRVVATPGGVAGAGIAALGAWLAAGIVGRMVWFTVLGLPGLCAVLVLGAVVRRADDNGAAPPPAAVAGGILHDVAVYIPTLIGAGVMAAALATVPGGRPGAALRALRRGGTQRLHRDGPAARTAVAGCLDGAGTAPRSAIRRAVWLYGVALFLWACVLAAAAGALALGWQPFGGALIERLDVQVWLPWRQ